jgi:hypothetical protein
LENQRNYLQIVRSNKRPQKCLSKIVILYTRNYYDKKIYTPNSLEISFSIKDSKTDKNETIDLNLKAQIQYLNK